jgi:hypothetical protein
MAEQYYIVSSLPFLRFGEAPPLTYPEFYGLCTPWLGERDRDQLRSSVIDIGNVSIEGVHNGTLRRWILFENSLRNEIVKFRAQRLGLSPEVHMRTDLPWDPSVVSHVIGGLGEGSPMEAEMVLLEIRWGFLTDQEVGHYFDLDALIIYALKLQILERLNRFNPEKGKQVLGKIIEESSGHDGK